MDVDKFVTVFAAFLLLVTSTGPEEFMVLRVYFMTGAPEGSTKSGFMEKRSRELNLQPLVYKA